MDSHDDNVPGSLTVLGSFFAVSTHPPGADPVPPWRPVTELTSPSQPLRDRVAAIRAALAARGGLTPTQIEPRAAASAVHLGMAARLAAPALGAAVLGGQLDLRPPGLWWQDVPGGTVPLSVPLPTPISPADPDKVPAPGRASASDGASASGWVPASGRAAESGPVPASSRVSASGRAAETGQAPASGRASASDGASASGRAPGLGPDAQDWDQVLLDELLAPMTAAVAELFAVSARVLWGNVASAVSAAAAQVAGQRPDLADAAWQAARLLFASRQLRGERNPPGPGFRRSSCCLFYRLAPDGPPALCGDCVLAARPAR
jgi:hypothetical protein